tara:strand:+ start:3726 stop:5405 length:1680 start_codon:yes stop_codon:yes gene_type:complete
MLIKTKLYGSGILLCALLVTVSIIATVSFSSLSNRFQQVVEASTSSAESATKTTQGSAQGSAQLGVINTEMLAIVDGINHANQRTKLLSKKVEEISATLTELTNTIEELSVDVGDEEALAILEEVGDEVGDISERLKREALIHIIDTSTSMEAFSQNISDEAVKVSSLDEFIKEQVQVSQFTSDKSTEIKTQAEQALGEINWQKTLIVSALVGLAVLSILSVVVNVRAAILPINKTVLLMQDIADGEGDLTQRLEVQGKDEMALIAGAFNRFVEKMQLLLVGVTQSTRELSDAAEHTYQAMTEGSSAIQRQQLEIEQIATAINEMNATSQEVARNAVSAATTTTEVNQHANLGKTVVNNARHSVSTLVDEVEDAVSVINSLSEKSANINSVVNVIRSISEQTNLLALNAAIEAARAGEQGRGFAVVADEVRALAGKAGSSTSDIQTMIEEIHRLTASAVAVMQTSQASSSSAVADADAASESLNAITGSILTIADMNTQIASAAEEQTAVADEINQRIIHVNELSQQTSSGVSNTVLTCEKLNKISDRLSQQLAQFKVS